MTQLLAVRTSFFSSNRHIQGPSSHSKIDKLSLSGNSATLDFTQSLHSAQDRGSAENSNGNEDVAQRQAAVVKEVNNLDRENGAEECCVGQRSSAQGFGQGANVCAQEAEPLL